MNVNFESKFYYSKFKVSLITMAIFLAIMPINVFLYDRGIYGKNYIDLNFIFKRFMLDSLKYDIIFTLTMILSFSLFIKSYITREYKKFDTNKDKKFSIGLIAICIISSTIVRIFFPPYMSITLFLCITAMIHDLINLFVKEFIKFKNYK